jgi:hypothetical protein
MIGIFYWLFGYQHPILLPQARAVQTVPPRPTGTPCAGPAPKTYRSPTAAHQCHRTRRLTRHPDGPTHHPTPGAEGP